ncbi:MAG: protein-L-isoaspartate(D-aspartate) O-methyltransferase [Betaproteobacteria bacterium]|jgi:protein-L-isoaspartate(D-aspartate) O-methyltransferase|nr:protein-L-isoaspartate(D-aspartate) O-methyltransferase [Betaproteobacteria bacterium]MDH5343435.1 protein-L-isoaspartate(D-aspartate) O-methyltransferase [Betaproteobacteria bacterium]
MNTANSGIGMTSQRTRMRMVERLRSEGIADEVILGAMGEVPRHIFVDEALASRAYEDMSLPLGFGQTISSPYTVARMLELLRNGGTLGKVLEIGTGCGYQAAVLSRIAREVYSMERLAPLLVKARRHLRDARAHNVRVRNADGQLGMPEHAPFDGIVVAAAATHVPQPLLDQLAVGGKIIIPLTHQGKQSLHVIERTPEGYADQKVEDARFVPLLPGLG